MSSSTSSRGVDLLRQNRSQLVQEGGVLHYLPAIGDVWQGRIKSIEFSGDEGLPGEIIIETHVLRDLKKQKEDRVNPEQTRFVIDLKESEITYDTGLWRLTIPGKGRGFLFLTIQAPLDW